MNKKRSSSLPKLRLGTWITLHKKMWVLLSLQGSFQKKRNILDEEWAVGDMRAPRRGGVPAACRYKKLMIYCLSTSSHIKYNNVKLLLDK